MAVSSHGLENTIQFIKASHRTHYFKEVAGDRDRGRERRRGRERVRGNEHEAERGRERERKREEK